MSRADTVKFELLYIVQVGQVVCLCLEDCPQYEGIVLRMNYNIEKHDHSHEIVLPFADSSMFQGTDTIRYRYIVSRYEDEKIKLRDVLDEKTGGPMELSFQRQDYWNSFVHIFDRCDYQLKDSRIVKSLKMDQVISTTIRIQETIPIGRWLYMFIINDVHPQKLESDFTKSKDEKNQMFFAEKMEKHQRSSGEQVWIYRRVTNMAELSRNNRFTFAIYESYLYDRREKVWRVKGDNPNLPNYKEEEFDDIEKLAKILDQQGVKYSIIQNDGVNQEEQKILTNLKPNQILRDTEFIYEVTDDIDKRTILSVFLVIKGKGCFKMDPKEGRKFWNVFVALDSSELNGLEYFFDVNIIGAIQNSTQAIDLRSTRRTSSQIIQFPRSRSNITVYSRSQFVEQRSYTPTYSNRTLNDYNDFETKLTPKPSTFYYIPSNRLASSTSYSYVSNVRREQEKLKITKTEYFSVIHEKSTSSSFKNVSDTLSSYSSRVGASVSLWTAPHQILSSISDSQFKSLPRSCKQSLESVADHLQSFNSLSREIKHLKMKFDQLSTVHTEKQAQQKFKNVVFTEQYGPVSLQLIQVVKKRTIEDDFKKEIDKLTKNSQNLRNLIKKQWDIEHTKDKTEQQYTQNEVQILAINMIVAAKLWGKQNYSGHKRIIDVLNNYLQQQNYSRQEIISVLYHLNSYVNNEKKYTYKVSHPMPDNCQKNIQDKVAAHFKLMNNGSMQPFEVIQNHKLYKLFVLLVDCDIKTFINFGKNQGLNIHYDQVSENLMRILINYAIIYSLGQHYDTAFSKFDVCGCAQFGPFCQEVSDKRFFSHDLISIRDKYEQTNKTNLQMISQNKSKIQNLKSQIQKTLESETERMAVALISIQYDLKKLQQYFDSNPNRKEFLHDVDLRNAYEKGLQKIDQSENWSEKYARIINFKNTYQKDFQSFN